MSRPVGSVPTVAGAAAQFAAAGVLDGAAPLLTELGWDGQLGGIDQVDPVTIGERYARAAGPVARHASGIHYTPPALAARLAAMVLCEVVDGVHGPVRVGDPACGAGAFLVAAAEVLRCGGVPVEDIVAECLFGADIDGTAVTLARLEIARWALPHTGGLRLVPEEHLVAHDGLADPWPGEVTGALDVVLGNPPFGSQLRGDTIRARAAQRRLASDLGLAALGYADTAGLFLVRSLGLVRSGGRVGLILPSSLAAAAGAARIRAEVGRRAWMESLWIGGDDVGFDADVSVFAPVFRTGGPTGASPRLRRYHGVDVVPLDTVDVADGTTNWAALLSTDRLVVDATVRAVTRADGRTVTLDAVADVRAGFRRHFYGLAPHVDDDPSGSHDAPVLVTTGAIDPLHRRSEVPVRYAGRDFTRPVVDLEGLGRDDADLLAWARGMLRPKVLVASQGRVVEAIVDPDGTLIPSTPVIAVVPRPGSATTVWHLAAWISSPRTTLLLHAMAGRTGMDGRGCRVTASFLRGLVAPLDHLAWAEGADAARWASIASAAGDGTAWATQLDRLGAAMALAEGSDDDVTDWWREQVPPWRGARLLRR